MSKVRIICLGKDRYSVVSSLHKLGLVDLRKSTLPLSDDTLPENHPKINDMLIKVEGAIGILGKPTHKSVKAKTPSGDPESWFAANEGKIKSIYDLKDELGSLSEDDRSIAYAERIGCLFGDINIDLGNLRSGVLSFSAVIINDKQLSALRKQGKKLVKNAEIRVHEPGKNENLLFAAYKKGDAHLEEALANAGEEVDLRAKYLDSTPRKVLEAVGRKKKENASRTIAVQKELGDLEKHYLPQLEAGRRALQIEFDRAEASASFKKTEHTVAIEGWLPKKRMAELKSALHKTTKGSFSIEDVKTDELAPTLVNRPHFLKSFDYLMEFFSLPRSDELDPTWIFIISFPIFYGFMISDVGYGVASAILSQLIIMKTDPDGLVYNAAKVWQISAIPAIIFGFITNQYFGLGFNNLFASGFQSISWLGDMTTIIIFTVIFGILQVSLGFIFGAINEWHHGHKKLAMTKITSIITLVFGTIAVAGGLFNAFPMSTTLYATAVCIPALLITLAFSGMEAAEITNLIIHPLSYARIMGFGLASVILATLTTAHSRHISAAE